MPHTKHKHRKLRSFYIWHRYVGLTAALFVITLSITGLALNHTDRLSLAKKYVQSEWLLNWYGIKAPDNLIIFKSPKHLLAYMDSKLYLDNKQIPNNVDKPKGLVSFPHFVAVSLKNEVLLLTHEGEMIERLSAVHGVPAGISKTGIHNDKIIIKTDTDFYQTDRDFLKWKKINPIKDMQWSKTIEPTADQLKHYSNLYRGKILSLERVILDLHSGSLLGKWGPAVMDIAAILLVFLSLSGFWLWLKQILRKHKRRQKKKLTS